MLPAAEMKASPASGVFRMTETAFGASPIGASRAYAAGVSEPSYGGVAILGRLAGWSTVANNGCSPNHFGKERTIFGRPSGSMAPLVTAALMSTSPVHT